MGSSSAVRARVVASALAVTALLLTGVADAGPALSDFSVFGEESVDIGESAHVEGAVGVWNAGSIAPARLVVGKGAQVVTSGKLAGASVLLGMGSNVGEVDTNALHDMGGKHGTVVPFANMPRLPPVFQAFPGTEVLVVRKGTTVTVTPDRTFAYIEVEAGGRLHFAAGLYQIGGMKIEDHARVFTDGDAQLILAWTLAIGNHSVMGPGGDPASDQDAEQGTGPLSASAMFHVQVLANSGADALAVQIGSHTDFKERCSHTPAARRWRTTAA